MRLECGWCHVQKRWVENLEDFEKITAVGVKPWCWEVGSDHGVEKLGSDHGVEKLGPTMVLRSWGPTMVLRSWVQPWCWEVGVRPWCWEVGSNHGDEKLGPTMVLRSWVQPWSWGFEIGPCRQTIEFLPLGQRMEFSGHRVEFSTVVVAVKFFGSQPAKMNWDLKHHEMCRMLGVLLA